MDSAHLCPALRPRGRIHSTFNCLLQYGYCILSTFSVAKHSATELQLSFLSHYSYNLPFLTHYAYSLAPECAPPRITRRRLVVSVQASELACPLSSDRTCPQLQPLKAPPVPIRYVKWPCPPPILLFSPFVYLFLPLLSLPLLLSSEFYPPLPFPLLMILFLRLKKKSLCLNSVT